VTDRPHRSDVAFYDLSNDDSSSEERI